MSVKKLTLAIVILLITAVSTAAAQVPQPGGTPVRIEGSGPGSTSLTALTAAEKTWLEKHTTIRVGMAPIFPPLKFSENGVIQGIEPDYLKLLSDYTGISFEYVIAGFSEMDAKVKAGEIDMFISFHIPERLEYMSFTEPLMEFKQIIITRNDSPFISGIGALKGKRVATVTGVKLYDKLLAPYPDIEVVPVDSMEQMFRAVAESRADALITKTFFAGYLINNYPILKIAGIANLPPEPYLYAVRKDYPELVSILNKAISAIPRDKQDAIVQKWFNVRLDYRPDWSHVRKWAFAIGAVITLVLGLTLFWNRRLAREVAKRTQAEKELIKAKAILQAAMDQSPAGIAIADAPDGRLRYVNDAGLLIRGGDRQSIVEGIGIDQYVASWQLLDLDGRPLRTDEVPLARAVLYGETSTREFMIRRREGDERTLLANAAPIKDESGEVVAGIVVFQDISERKLIEQELQDKNSELERFTYTVSHDLKSPLITINTFAGMLREGLKTGNHENMPEDLDRISAAAHKMGMLLDDLLQLSRIGRMMNAPARIDMGALAGETLKLLEGTVGQRQIEIVVQPDLPDVFGDRQRVAAVLQNLLENAFKYLGGQTAPRVEIGACRRGQETVFFVSDNGIGIDPRYHEEVFGLFRKLDSRSDGTGIGLALVKRIIEVHGGRVWVESEGAGTGSRFLFTVPEGRDTLTNSESSDSDDSMRDGYG